MPVWHFKNLPPCCYDLEITICDFKFQLRLARTLAPPKSILRPGQFLLQIHDLLDLHEKPAVDFRQVENLFDGKSGAEGVADEENPLRVRHAQFAADDVMGEDVAVAIDFRADTPGFAVAAQAAAADFEGPQAFLQ